MHKLAVKLEGLEKRRRNTPLLHLSAAFFLFAKALDYVHFFWFQNILTAIPFFAVAVVSVVYGIRMKKWDPSGQYNHWLRLLQAGLFLLLGFLFFGKPGIIDELISFFWAGVCIYLYVIEKRVFKDLYLQIDKEGIQFPGNYSNQLLVWKSIKDVVARPDFVTIFKDNDQFLQMELSQHEEAGKLESINSFCRQQIKQNN
jgi:hypothetical protein